MHTIVQRQVVLTNFLKNAIDKIASKILGCMDKAKFQFLPFWSQYHPPISWLKELSLFQPETYNAINCYLVF